MRFHISLFLLAACAVHEDDLSSLESEASVYYWTDDVQIANQSSDRQVALTYYGGRTYQVHTADNSTQLRYSRFNGTSWSSELNIPDQLSDRAPALATYANRPTLVYKSASANQFRMSTFVNGAWTAPSAAGAPLGLTYITSSPSIAVHEGALLLAYCRDMGSYDRVQIDRYDGTSWTALTGYSLVAGDVCKHVAIASLPGNRFDLVFHNDKRFYRSDGAAYNDDYMFEVTGIGTPSSAWVPQIMSMRTVKPISIVHCNGTSHLVHGGYSNPDRIYWSHRTSSGWASDAYLTNTVSSGGTTLACHDTRTIMVHNGGYPNLWWAEYIEP